MANVLARGNETRMAIDKLNGKNWVSWRYACSLLLEKNRMWQIVTRQEIRPAPVSPFSWLIKLMCVVFEHMWNSLTLIVKSIGLTCIFGLPLSNNIFLCLWLSLVVATSLTCSVTSHVSLILVHS
jgi:hypothetical protein